MAIDNSVKTWSKKITAYCLDHCINYQEFARQSGISVHTIKNILYERIETIQIKTLGPLKKFLDTKND